MKFKIKIKGSGNEINKFLGPSDVSSLIKDRAKKVKVTNTSKGKSLKFKG